MVENFWIKRFRLDIYVIVLWFRGIEVWPSGIRAWSSGLGNIHMRVLVCLLPYMECLLMCPM